MSYPPIQKITWLLKRLWIVSLLFSLAAPLALADETANLAVHAVVPASPTDFQADLTAITPDPVVPQNQIISYQIKYGSLLSYPTSTLTVEAEWSLGTINGDTTPMVTTLSYVSGSASTAYNSTPAVIDPVNRKITWTIPSFPANTTDQIVTFDLKTTKNYTGSSDVSFTVMGRVLGPGTSTPDSSDSKTYRFDLSLEPTPTPTPLPTDAPSATPQPANSGSSSSSTSTNPTSTPTPPTSAPSTTSAAETFLTISLPGISPSAASLFINLNSPSAITVNYGTSPTALNQQVVDNAVQKSHRIELGSLSKSTRYYFRVTATNSNGQKSTSDIYTLLTATEPQAITVTTNSLLITSGEVGLHYPGSPLGEDNLIVLPNDSSLTTQFRVGDPTVVKSIELFLSNDNILGYSIPPTNDDQYAMISPMQTLKPGLFVGKIRPSIMGNYTVYIRLSDIKGNITEEPLFHIRSVHPIRVFAQGTNQPIEHARIAMSVYNPQTKIYDAISEAIVGITNPLFTNYAGIASVVLPAAEYRLEISAIGYTSQTVTFSLGAKSEQTYPLVLLQKTPFSITSLIDFASSSLSDSSMWITQLAKDSAHSPRFYRVAGSIIILCFVLLTFMATLARMNIPLKLLHRFFLHHLRTTKTANAQLTGTILEDEKEHPVSNARIVLIDAKTNQIITQTISDNKGNFMFHVPTTHAYTLEVIKIGYQPFTITLSDQMVHQVLHIATHPHTSFKHLAIAATGWIMNTCFEILFLISILLEIFLALGVGIWETTPFFLLTALNCGIWLYYLVVTQKTKP